MSAYSLVVNPGAIAIPLLLDYDALLPLYFYSKVQSFGIILIANHFRRRITR